MAAILCVADAYQAMTSDRPYRKAFTEDRAVEERRKGAGSQFDQEVVEAFLKGLESRSKVKVVVSRKHRFDPPANNVVMLAS